MSEPLFSLGQIVVTPGALALGLNLYQYVERHQRGDWGDICEQDWKANDRSAKDGTRILSAYETDKGRIWIIAEADRNTTTIMLPGEYYDHFQMVCEINEGKLK